MVTPPATGANAGFSELPSFARAAPPNTRKHDKRNKIRPLQNMVIPPQRICRKPLGAAYRRPLSDLMFVTDRPKSPIGNRILGDFVRFYGLRRISSMDKCSACGGRAIFQLWQKAADGLEFRRNADRVG